MSEKQPFGPDTMIPPNATTVDVWAEISATDHSGITVDGIKAGDVVEIVDVSGICSFDSNLGQKVLSLVAIISGTAAAASSLFDIEKVEGRIKDFKHQASELAKEAGDALKGSRRDGYGQDPGTGEFATEEGGLLVCMPSACGVFYATEENHLTGNAHEDGRLLIHTKSNLQDHNCFFPCRKDGGVMKTKAKQDGTLHIIAFDSNFGDNAGKYEVKFRVSRPTPEGTSPAKKKNTTSN